MRRVLILVENLPLPFDRRVWQEATTLQGAGYEVAIICPTGMGFDSHYEELEGIHIYRYDLPLEARAAKEYFVEYTAALWNTFKLAKRIKKERGFDVIQACNPPDLFFIIGRYFKLFYGTKFIFDHHDINPEFFEAKFARRGLFWHMLRFVEKRTFKTADISIATNNSYREIAIERGEMQPDRVFVVRSGPNLDRLTILPPKNELKLGRKYLVGYVGVIAEPEGIDLLLHSVKYIVNELQRTDIHFGLVGGGISLLEMQDLSKQLGVADYVTFTGRVPDRELLEMLNTADVCVNPDKPNAMNDKSTMNKIMEYMALSKPIVQFDLKEGRYSAGDSSLYARPGDYQDFANKIVELIEDSDKRRAMGELGRRRVESELAWTFEAPKLLAAYNALWKQNSADNDPPES